MRREYLQGSSVKDIAQKYNMTREAIYLRLRGMPNWKEISKVRRAEEKGSYLKQYKDRIEELYTLGEEGNSMISMHRITGIPYDHIRLLLKGTKYDTAHKVLRERNKEVRRLHTNGMSRYELAERFGLSYGHISKIVTHQIE